MYWSKKFDLSWEIIVGLEVKVARNTNNKVKDRFTKVLLAVQNKAVVRCYITRLV